MVSLKKIIVVALTSLQLSACGTQSTQSVPVSAQNVPTASFIFAGPVAEPDDEGGMTVAFKYALAVHTISPTRIQILDANSGEVLLDDTQPLLTPSQLHYPPNPSLIFSEWEGRTAAEKITSTSPSWLFSQSNTKVTLEARVYSKEQPVATYKQDSTYSYAAKAAILKAAEYNKTLKKQR